jgi:hypothetical protein
VGVTPAANADMVQTGICSGGLPVLSLVAVSVLTIKFISRKTGNRIGVLMVATADEQIVANS